MVWTFNPQNEGIAKVFRDYQEEAVKFVWEVGDQGVTSREVWIKVNERLIGNTKPMKTEGLSFY